MRPPKPTSCSPRGSSTLFPCRRHSVAGGLPAARGLGSAPSEKALYARAEPEALSRHRRPVALGLVYAGAWQGHRKRRRSEPIGTRPALFSSEASLVRSYAILGKVKALICGDLVSCPSWAAPLPVSCVNHVCSSRMATARRFGAASECANVRSRPRTGSGCNDRITNRFHESDIYASHLSG